LSTGSACSKCTLEGREWKVVGDPFVLHRLGTIFPLARRTVDAVYIPATPEQSYDLFWFGKRYPMQVHPAEKLRSMSAQFRLAQIKAEKILDPGYQAKPVKFASGLKARDYQLVGSELWKLQQGLLIADELGLGKTVQVIAAYTDPRLLPAVVVVPLHLARQWAAQIKRFLPQLKTHIVQGTTAYSLKCIAECPSCEAIVDTIYETKQLSPTCPNCKRRFSNYTYRRPPDVIIVPYSRLSGWEAELSLYAKSVAFDEAHSLRSHKTAKWQAAKFLSRRVGWRVGLTATPLFNMGGEAWNLYDILCPGFLGTKENFQETWCQYQATSKEPPLRDPDAFGAYLRSSKVMIRRTAAEVGVPVQSIQRIYHQVDADASVFDKSTDKAGELARLLLSGQGARGADLLEFDSIMRQATGLAKAVSVAAFVSLLVEQGEPVVLFGWHRAVYDVWMEELKKYSPVMYTGTENANQKEAALNRFLIGDSKVFICSLRSGEGLDGLQHVSAVTVHGELDWASAVHRQGEGRVARDGQKRPTLAYYCVSDFGSDPIVSQVLGVKQDQLDGIIGNRELGPVKTVDNSSSIRKLAQDYLRRR
jgi:SNF2 family DNA or RNA helicase